MSIVLVGSTSGSITLQEPAVAGSNTINLPAATGTMALLQTPSFATTIGVGNSTPSTSGAGITFPATQSASTDANTLDDYEEGTFTPTVTGTSTAGTATYGNQQARYTKIGRLVYIEMYLGWSTGTGTGNLQISGLPFTSSNSSTFPALSIGYPANLALSANNVLNVYVNNNNTTINIQQYPIGGGASTAVAYDANAEILVAGCYSV